MTVPTIDRHAELDWLEAHARGVLDALAGQLVTVQGTRGVGKSRVANAFRIWCQEQTMTVLYGQCVGSAAEPLLPIRDALRPVLGTTARAVRAALRRSAPELLDGVPIIGKFLAGFGRELTAGPQLGGDSPRGLYDVLASVVTRLGRRNGLCLIIEDAHVADPDTLSFLSYLQNKSREYPVLILITFPTEESNNEVIADCLAEWSERGCETLTIQPFNQGHVEEYVVAALGENVLAKSTRNYLFHFTGGNPLLLAESIRQLQLAEKEEDLSKLPSASIEIPERIGQLLERRLQRLDEQVRWFIEVAAVVNETSREVSPVFQLLGVDEHNGLALLDRACNAGLLREDADGQISFTSELLHMVAYGLLGPNKRRSVHLEAGKWFENHQQFSEAAHHYERAQDWPLMLPAAFRAAEVAEHVGLYQAALSWYRKLQGLANPSELFPRMARALMVVGAWREAGQVIDALPPNDSQTLMLRSQLCFARGDITKSAEYANQAMGRGAAEDMEVLLRLAKIDLYGGNFARAVEYAGSALQIAQDSGSVNDQAGCHIVLGACQLYNNELEAAEQSFSNGIWLLQSCSPVSRDVGVHSALLGNRGFVEEIKLKWLNAEHSHREALRMRSEVADAVGVLESTLAIGRVLLGQGKLRDANEHLTAALRLADDLGEELQKAKIIHAMGQLAARNGNIEQAASLVEDARRRFVKCGTPYDVAYADLSLADVLSGTNRRMSIERLAIGRAAVDKNGFELLRRLFPELQPRLSDRIHAGLLAYIAGDALGLPWEGKGPGEVRMELVDHLPKPEVWPRFSTSDDTALTLLVCEHLARESGKGDPQRLLERLAAQSGSIHGLGPSTKHAIAAFHATGEPDHSGSNTNGGAMRALPIGWALPASAKDQRRDWTVALARITHTGQDAVAAACVMSACASWAIEGAPPRLLIEIAVEEAMAVGADTAVAKALTLLHEGRWTPPSAGISLDAAETATAVLYCCHEADGDLVASLHLAVSLGGDTDTVTALTGGLLGCRLTPDEARARLTWLNKVTQPPAADLARLGKALAGIRLTADE